MDNWDVTTNPDGATGDLPSVPSVPSLTVLAGEAQRSYRVGDRARVGRAQDAEVRLSSDEVSRHHLLVERQGQQYLVVDLNSKNGSRLNGHLLRPGVPEPLHFGDRLTLGRSVLLLFTPHDDVEEQLMMAQRLESLGRLAGGVAHDFNNLLGTVITNLSYLRRLQPDTRLDHPDVRTTIDDSHAALRRASELTRQLLGFARQSREHDRPVNFSELVGEVVRMLRRTIDPAVSITEEIDPKIVVIADSNQLQQVLMNLVLNAADALSGGGQIQIRLKEVLGGGLVSSQRPHALLEVEDNGHGMDELTRARAFEPFFTTKEVGRGTGLGLSLVYGVAKSYGGEAQIESESGRGTKVRFLLPVASAPELPTPVSGSRSLADSPTGLVLLIDDEDLFRASTTRMLRHLGFQVAPTRSGREALELVRSHPGVYRVVMLDLVMPDLTGEATFEALRRLEPDAQVIVISGHHDGARVEALLAAGARAFVPKPFDLETLRKELKEAVEASS